MKQLLRISYLLFSFLVFSITAQAQPTVHAYNFICPGSTLNFVLYNAPPGPVNWYATGATVVAGQGNDTATIYFPPNLTPLYGSGMYYVEIQAQHSTGTAFSTASWMMDQVPGISSGPLNTCANGPMVEYQIPYTSFDYSFPHSTSTNILNASVTGGTIVSVSDTNWPQGIDWMGLYKIRVQWGGGSSGTLSYCADFSRGGTSCRKCRTYNVSLAPANPGGSTVHLGNDTTACVLPFTLDAGSGHSWIQWNTGVGTQTLSPTWPGTYSVWVRDPAGCSADTIVVSSGLQPSMPVINPAGPVTGCNTSPPVLGLTQAYSAYQWTGGSTGATFTPTSSGNYTCTVTDAAGCRAAAAPVAVTLNSFSGPVYVFPTPAAICSGAPLPLNVTVYTQVQSYLWSNGATTQSTIVTTPGTYTCTVTDLNGCTAAGSRTVGTGTTPVATITPAQPYICNGGSTVLDAGPGYFSYSWSGNNVNFQTNQTLGVAAPGTYSVIVTTYAGCKDTVSVTVGTGTTTSISVSSSLPSACPASPATLTAPPGYASYLWSNGATTQTTVVPYGGNYRVSATPVGGGCPAIGTIVIQSSPPPIIISPTMWGVCPGMTTATLSTQPAYASYLWSTGSTSPSVNVPPGLYGVTVTDAFGCTTESQSYTQVSTVNSCATPFTPALTIMSPTSIHAVWARVACARSYRIHYRQQGTSTWNTVTVLDPGNSVTITGLNSNTTYEVRISVYCNLMGASAFSGTILITTPVLRAGAPDPAPEAGPSAFTLELWPNPNAGQFTVSYPAAAAGEVNLRVVDLEGRIVYADVRVMEEGVNLLELNLPPVAAGLYLLRMESAEGLHVKRFRIQE